MNSVSFVSRRLLLYVIKYILYNRYIFIYLFYIYIYIYIGIYILNLGALRGVHFASSVCPWAGLGLPGGPHWVRRATWYGRPALALITPRSKAVPATHAPSSKAVPQSPGTSCTPYYIYFLHVDFQHHFLKSLSFLHCIAFAILSKIHWLYLGRSISGFSILFF